jgi:hypothetical protein
MPSSCTRLAADTADAPAARQPLPVADQQEQDWHMQVSLLYFANCPNWSLARQRLRQALDLAGRADTDIRLVPVETEAEATAVGFAGSPTFVADGVDLFGHGSADGALTCRMYVAAGGPAGVPTVEDLVAALRKKADR